MSAPRPSEWASYTERQGVGLASADGAGAAAKRRGAEEDLHVEQMAGIQSTKAMCTS